MSRNTRSSSLLVAITAAVFVSLGGLVACADSSFELPTSGTLDLVLTVAPKTVSAGGVVTVSTSAIGTQLFGTVIEYGDGGVDSVTAAGAQTQSATRDWTYDTAGVFVIRATVDDAVQGRLSREDTVTVN